MPVAAGAPLVAYGDRDLQAAGGLLVAFGVVAGPALGHVYAENHGQARRGMWIRGLAGATPFFVAGVQQFVSRFVLPFVDQDSELSPVLLGVAGVLVGGSAAYDIATAPHAVRERGGLAVHPRVGLRGAGLTARVRF